LKGRLLRQQTAQLCGKREKEKNVEKTLDFFHKQWYNIKAARGEGRSSERLQSWLKSFLKKVCKTS
jgi:hypothetical protein